jgi:transcriptional regulator GlxA family with amidase domain
MDRDSDAGMGDLFFVDAVLGVTRLILRWISPAIMMATARFFLVDSAGREQRFYAAFAPRLQHGDDTVLQVQHWFQVH